MCAPVVAYHAARVADDIPRGFWTGGAFSSIESWMQAPHSSTSGKSRGPSQESHFANMITTHRLSILHRPKKPTSAIKNAENAEVEYEREQVGTSDALCSSREQTSLSRCR